MFCNSGCMDLVYDGMRYTVYRWEFPYLNYSFDISISWIHLPPMQQVLSYLYISSLDALFMFGCVCSRYDFQYMLFYSNLLIHVCLSMHTIWHSSHHSLGCFNNPRPTCPDFRAWSLWILPVANQKCTAEAWIIGKSSGAPSFQPPYSALEFSFVTREHLLYSS